jgi:hypothetical protein
MTAATTRATVREPLAGHVRQGDFRHRAACRAVDPEVFFPAAESGPRYEARVLIAKAVCAGCPVREQCLTWALSTLPDGIAGGMTEHERRTERDRRARARRAAGSTTRKGESAPVAAGAPSQVSHNTNAWAGTRAVEGHRG